LRSFLRGQLPTVEIIWLLTTCSFHMYCENSPKHFSLQSLYHIETFRRHILDFNNNQTAFTVSVASLYYPGTGIRQWFMAENTKGSYIIDCTSATVTVHRSLLVDESLKWLLTGWLVEWPIGQSHDKANEPMAHWPIGWSPIGWETARSCYCQVIFHDDSVSVTWLTSDWQQIFMLTDNTLNLETNCESMRNI